MVLINENNRDQSRYTVFAILKRYMQMFFTLGYSYRPIIHFLPVYRIVYLLPLPHLIYILLILDIPLSLCWSWTGFLCVSINKNSLFNVNTSQNSELLPTVRSKCDYATNNWGMLWGWRNCGREGNG